MAELQTRGDGVTAKKRRSCPLCGQSSFDKLFVKDGFDYVKCVACSQMYISDVLSDNAHLEEDYYCDTDLLEKEPLEDSSVRGGRMRRLIHHMERTQGPSTSLRILDVGCGKGWHLAFLKKKGYSALRGVEVNEKVAQAARSRGLTIDEGFLQDQKYPDGSFDVVFLDQVIEHLEEPKEVLAEIRRILKPGGLCWASVPNIDAWHIKLWLKEKHRHFEGARHLNYYTGRTLAKLLRLSGFSVKSVISRIEEATIQRIKGVITSPTDFESTEVRRAAAKKSASLGVKSKPSRAGLKKFARLAASPVNLLLIGMTRLFGGGAYLEIAAVKD